MNHLRDWQTTTRQDTTGQAASEQPLPDAQAPGAAKPEKASHHHGNLRPALVQAGIDMLESGEAFSLRAVARRVGVSQTAPYRHFADKEHLEAAMGAQGFRALQASIEEVIANATPDTQLVELALAYVHYAVDNPALYRLMYGHPCGENDERLESSAEVFAIIEQLAVRDYPNADPYGLATAGWALAHGLASLSLDGKLPAEGRAGLDERVRQAFAAILQARREESFT